MGHDRAPRDLSHLRLLSHHVGEGDIARASFSEPPWTWKKVRGRSRCLSEGHVADDPHRIHQVQGTFLCKPC